MGANEVTEGPGRPPTLAERLARPEVTEQLSNDGYAVVDLLDPAEAAAACAALADLGTAPDDGGLARIGTNDSQHADYRVRAEAVAAAAIAGAGGLTQPRLPQFVVTWPGDHSGLGLHHPGAPDASPAEVQLEVALDQAHEGNGRLFVVPGSHRWHRHPLPRPIEDAIAEDVSRRHAVPVELGIGQALVTAATTLRFSLPNQDLPKRSLTFWVPSPTDHRDEGVASTLGLDHLARLDATGPTNSSPIEAGEAPNARRPRCSSCGTPIEELGETHPWNGVHRTRCARCPVGPVARIVDRPARPHRRPPISFPLPTTGLAVLRDGDLDERLAADGYVVVPEPVLAPEAAAELRRAFLDLHRNGGRGHLNDFNQRDRPYREEATRLMRAHLEDVLAPLFVDHDPFLCTFLCKWPDDESDLEPHQDWMYVDERAGERTHLAFVALDDIGPGRGEVQVVPGSHLLDAMPRGTGLRAPWLDHDAVMAERLQTIPIQLGQCAIWNSALVHASLPNGTASPRVAAGLWFSRRRTPLVHYRRLDERSVAMFEIDADFYRTQNPYRLMVSNPPYAMVEVVDAAGRDLPPDVLTSEIDRVQGVLLADEDRSSAVPTQSLFGRLRRRR